MTMTTDKTCAWVLVIEHKSGTTAHIHLTEAGAKATLLAWVTEWWECDGPDGVPMSDNADDNIRSYFDSDNKEFYTLMEAVVEP